MLDIICAEITGNERVVYSYERDKLSYRRDSARRRSLRRSRVFKVTDFGTS